MLKRFSAVLAASLLAAAILITTLPGTANAVGFGVSAGVFIPGGDISFYDPGLGINAYADFTLVPMLLDFRIAANHYQTKGSKNDIDYKLNSTGGQALVILAPPVPIIKPYVGAGYGVYKNSHEIKYAGNKETKDKWGNGFVLQAGVGVDVLILTLGIDGQYLLNNQGDNYGGYSIGARIGLSL